MHAIFPSARSMQTENSNGRPFVHPTPAAENHTESYPVLHFRSSPLPYPRPAQGALTSPKPKPTLRSPFGFWTLLSTFWMALAWWVKDTDGGRVHGIGGTREQMG